MAYTLMVDIIDYVMNYAKGMEENMSFTEVILYFWVSDIPFLSTPPTPCVYVCVNNAHVYA